MSGSTDKGQNFTDLTEVVLNFTSKENVTLPLPINKTTTLPLFPSDIISFNSFELELENITNHTSWPIKTNETIFIDASNSTVENITVQWENSTLLPPPSNFIITTTSSSFLPESIMTNHNNDSDTEMVFLPPDPMGTTEMILTLIPLCTIIFCVIFGNVLVITAVFKKRALRTPQNFYLVSLACVDLSVGIFILPLNILNQVQRGWYLGMTICKLYCTLDITLCTMSIMHLCCIAWDRYKAISEGINYIQRRTMKTVLVTIFAITVLSIWISSPPILGWDSEWLKDIEETKECKLLGSRGYVVYSASGSLFFPLIMMGSLYVLIYYGLRDRIRKRAKTSMKKREANGTDRLSNANLAEESQSGNELDNEDSTDFLEKTAPTSEDKPDPNQPRGKSQQFQEFIRMKQKFSLRKERNAAKTLGIIMAAFVLCWGPFSFMYVLVPFCCESSPPPVAVFETLTWLGYFNCALNPVIYSIFNLEFRKAFKSLLHLK